MRKSFRGLRRLPAAGDVAGKELEQNVPTKRHLIRAAEERGSATELRRRADGTFAPAMRGAQWPPTKDRFRRDCL